MTVLNQILRDLEKRGAMPDVVAAAGTATVARPPHTSPAPTGDRLRRWTWAGVVAVAAAFIAVHGWLSYRVQQASVVRPPLGARQFTPAPNVKAAAPAQASPVAPAAAAAVAVREPDRANPAATTVASIPTSEAPPWRAAPRANQSRSAMRPPASTPARTREASSARTTAPAATVAPAPAIVVRSTEDGTTDFDRAADLIAQGRSTEATELLEAILARQPAHAAARGRLAALLAGTGRRQQALQVLLAGSELDPVRFAPTAAQLQAELGDADGALVTLARVPSARRTARLEALQAGLAQRAGDHLTAIAAYRRALVQPQAEAVWWVGLGVSLEATGEPLAARHAYTRAAAEPRLPPEVRSYASERLTALEAHAAAALANVF